MTFDWEKYIESRPDLKKNWNSPIRALIHKTIVLKIDEFLEKSHVSVKENNSRGIVVHGLHKSGTMFLVLFFHELLKNQKYIFFSDNWKIIKEKPSENLKKSISTNFCLCVERKFKNRIEDKKFKNMKEIVHLYQVRDPRDILVSQYYSFGWTHSSEGAKNIKRFEKTRMKIQSQTIDEYVLATASRVKRKYVPLSNKSGNYEENELVIKYEDMVLEFHDWTQRIVAFLKLENPEEIIEGLYSYFKEEFNINKIQEGKFLNSHKRKMTPGDYKDKLKPETIEKLNTIFAKELRLFGYER